VQKIFLLVDNRRAFFVGVQRRAGFEKILAKVVADIVFILRKL